MRILIIILFTSFQLFAQDNNDTNAESEPSRPVIVFIHTDWCKYCERMKAEIFENEKILSELTEKYTVLLLNAESEESFDFFGKKFYYQPTGIGTGFHEFAGLNATNEFGKLTYPTICIYTSNGSMIDKIQGYISASQLLDRLKNQVL